MKKLHLLVLSLIAVLTLSTFVGCGGGTGGPTNVPSKPENCTHEYFYGSCYICNTACEHTYDCTVCTICDMPCNHSASESTESCTVCGKVFQEANFTIKFSSIDEQNDALSFSQAMYLDEILATYTSAFFFIDRFELADITIDGVPVTNGKTLLNKDTEITITHKTDVKTVTLIMENHDGNTQEASIVIPASGKSMNYFACLILGGIGNLNNLLIKADVSIDGTPITDGNYLVNKTCSIKIKEKENSGNQDNQGPISIDFEFHLENSNQWEKQHLELPSAMTFKQVVETYFNITWEDFLTHYYGATDGQGNPVGEDYLIDKYTIISLYVVNSGSGDNDDNDGNDEPNNCEHEWEEGFCEKCETYCNHKWNKETCVFCGHVSGGIDNPITIYYNDMEMPVQYSAMFMDLYVHGIISEEDYNNPDISWQIINENGETFNITSEYINLCDLGRYLTLIKKYNNPNDGDHQHSWDFNGYCTECNTYCQHDQGMNAEGYCYICGISSGAWVVNVTYNGAMYNVDGQMTVKDFVENYLFLNYDDIVMNGKIYIEDVFGNRQTPDKNATLYDYGTDFIIRIEFDTDDIVDGI